MAITDINISEQLETGAPSIKYTGKEGPRPSMQSQQEMQIAQQIWEAMGDEERGQFSNFQEFFRSGIWKQILQQAQQDEAQGIQSLGPRNMEQGPRLGAQYGGRIGYENAGSVMKDPDEVVAGMDNELNPGWFDKIPLIGGYEGKYPVNADQGASLIEKIQDYKYGHPYEESQTYGGTDTLEQPPLSMEETIAALEAKWDQVVEDDWGFSEFEKMGIYSKEDIRRRVELGYDQAKGPVTDTGIMKAAQGGRTGIETLRGRR